MMFLCVNICKYTVTWISMVIILIQLYCLRHVLNNQVFIFRKTCTCSFMVFFMHPYKQSGRSRGVFDAELHVQVFLGMNIWLFEKCQNNKYNWIKSSMKNVWILLVLNTYVYHKAWFKKRKAWLSLVKHWSFRGQLQYWVQPCCANFLQEKQGVDEDSLNTETHKLM
jgi:hypothetical protein